MLLIFFIGLVNSQCNVKNTGLYSGLSHQIAHSLNQFRNQVATGQVSFEGSKSASNMNVIHWDSGLAKRGQQCAEKCPAHVGTCAFHQDYGVLTQHIPKGSAKGAQDVIDIWIKDNHKAKQILFAREQKFGCGKAENDKMLYVVCYFDKKYTNKIQTFLPGPVGASCQLGMSKMYSGLCAVAGQTNLIHQSEQRQVLLTIDDDNFM